MYSLIYVSIATKLFDSGELLSLLEQARLKNQKADVTGMLLYKEGNFMQVLEGEEPVVHALAAKISRDPRHHKMVTMFEGPVDRREFSDWSMGFSNLDLLDAGAPPGFSEFMNTPLTAGEFTANPARAHRLLNVFKRS